MRNLGGKPLIQWTIEAAQKSGAFGGIIVSSDSEETLNLARDLGCLTHKRPDDLATSRATIFDVCKDFLQGLTTAPNSFAVLIPTSPLRTAQDIHNAVELFNSSEAKCVMSVCEFEYPPQWALELSTGLGFKDLLIPSDHDNINTKRQDLYPSYRHDGSIIICDIKEFLHRKDWHEMWTVIPYVMPRERAVDIDEPIDFKWAEFLLGETSGS